MKEDVLDRVRVFVMSQEPRRAIEALRLIDALAAEVRELRVKVIQLEVKAAVHLAIKEADAEIAALDAALSSRGEDA